MGMSLCVDRFDPGVAIVNSSSSSSNSSGDMIKPTAPLPNDLVIPVSFEFEKPDGPDVMYTFSVGHFELGLQVCCPPVCVIVLAVILKISLQVKLKRYKVTNRVLWS